MDWKTLIDEIRSRHVTYQEIATEAGMSKGAVHDLCSGRAKTVAYETGVKLVAMHQRIMRRKVQ